jgi:hypothetical protein
MTVAFEAARKALVEVLLKRHHRVVALTGSWGTGKSHLWHEIRKSELEKESPSPVYFSIFGAKSSMELKLRALQSALPADGSKLRDGLAATGELVKGLAKKLTGVSAEDLMVLAVPSALKGRLVVLDDIERKHKSLDVDEVLGFINEYSELHAVRFLLLLNSDKLTDRSVWHQLHEKVIDVEIALNPSSRDAFDIALGSRRIPLVDEIKAALGKLEVNNIRIIKRVIRIAEHIVGDAGRWPRTATARLCASLVLLSVLHYHGVPDGPTTEQLRVLLSNEADARTAGGSAQWERLLALLGIDRVDGFSVLVLDYLSTGVLDRSALDALLSSYRKSAAQIAASKKLDEFADALEWDPTRSNDQLLATAREMIVHVQFLDMHELQSLYNLCWHFRSAGLPVTDEINAEFVRTLETREDIESILQGNARFDRGLDASIRDELNRVRARRHPPGSIVELMSSYDSRQPWSDWQAESLRASTVEDHEAAFGRLTGKALRAFFDVHIEWMKQPHLRDEFAQAAKNFAAACRRILQNSPQSRQAQIIERELERAKIDVAALRQP